MDGGTKGLGREAVLLRRLDLNTGAMRRLPRVQCFTQLSRQLLKEPSGLSSPRRQLDKAAANVTQGDQCPARGGCLTLQCHSNGAAFSHMTESSFVFS